MNDMQFGVGQDGPHRSIIGTAPLEKINIYVLGEATPEGSTRSFYIAKANRTVTTHQNQKELKAWRNRVATEAQHVLESSAWGCDNDSSYGVEVKFVLSRPSSIPVHRRLRPIVKPDIDKLIRAINDALTGIIFPDDCQVVHISCTKEYNDQQRSGAYITVSRYGNVTERTRVNKSKKIVRSDDPISDDPRDD